MIDLDNKKHELQDLILAGDFDGIIKAENDIRRLEIESFARRAAEVKNQISDAMQNRAKLERKRAALEIELERRNKVYADAIAVADVARIEMQKCQAVLFSIDSGIENCRDSIRQLNDSLKAMMKQRFGGNDNEK